MNSFKIWNLAWNMITKRERIQLSPEKIRSERSKLSWVHYNGYLVQVIKHLFFFENRYVVLYEKMYFKKKTTVCCYTIVLIYSFDLKVYSIHWNGVRFPYSSSSNIFPSTKKKRDQQTRVLKINTAEEEVHFLYPSQVSAISR